MKSGRKALAVWMSLIPWSRSSLAKRSCRVWLARSTRPLACGVLACIASMSSVLSARELRQFPLSVRMIDPENAVFIRVEGNGASVLTEILCKALHIGLRRLRGHKAQILQTTTGIINEDNECAGRGASLEPVMG